MTIYTPRGLKVRVTVAQAFALMRRLWPSVTPFSFLKTVEAIESIPSVLAICAGTFAIVLQERQSLVIFATAMAYAIGVIWRSTSAPPAALIRLCTTYSYFSGFGAFALGMLYLGYRNGGLLGATSFFVGLFVGWLFRQWFEFRQSRRLLSETGQSITQSELSFWLAYRFHAYQIGKSQLFCLEEEELAETNWLPLYTRFCTEWPDVARRFVF